MLRNPFRLEGVVDEVLARTEPFLLGARSLPLPPESLWPLLDAEPGAWPDQLPGLPGSLDSALPRIRANLARQTASLSGAELDFLFREASSLFLMREEDATLDPVPAELKRLREDARGKRVLELAGRLDRDALVRASSAAWGLEAWILDSLRGPDSLKALARLKRLAARAQVPLVMGTHGSDSHRPDRGIWIDPGGDDRWDFAPRGRPGEFLLVVDLGGNDLYRSRDSLHRSPGNLGVSLIADLGGDDHYLGLDFAFGSALFGYSHLFDAGGNDYYEGRCASLGFASFGIGVLQDEAGSDVYSASVMSQGASSTRGLGLLLDRAGDDRYLARPTFQDDLRYEDRYLNMVQGFSTGMAPDYAGGIGVLRDQKGNDVYLADIYGQGSGYWYAMGLLLDEAGDDRYEAFQYAQGAGVHIAVGAAVDWAGNDRRSSKGVSQGCGHDLGFGLLHDRAGDDSYLGVDKIQGSGSANGLGLLQDMAGNDIYSGIAAGLALGAADMRRERGSYGFFLDAGGKDRYAEQKDGAAWSTFNGETRGNGFGLDLSGPILPPVPGKEGMTAAAEPSEPGSPPPPVRQDAAAVPALADTAPGVRRGFRSPVFDYAPPALSRLDTLFITAATGEPRFQAMRDTAEKRLVAGGAATLDYLLAARLVGQTPRQRHYVERLFILVSDSGKRPEAAARLDKALPTAPDSLKVQLLRIGSALGDRAFLATARKYLQADSVEVRKMAVRSLGTYPDPSDLPFLLEAAARTKGLERQMLLWALSKHPPLKDWPRLLPALKDEQFYNRQWARRLLAKAAKGDWKALEKRCPLVLTPEERREWVLLARDLKGSDTFLRREIPRLTPESRRVLGEIPPQTTR